MKIGNDNDHIELTEQKRVPKSLPTSGDVKVKVVVQLQEFRGMYENVWLDKNELHIFLKELEKLNETRNGKVKLKSLSPDEFWMEIRSIDKVGHFEVQTQLKRYQYSAPKNWPTMVAGGFELDPSQLETVIKGFRALVE